MKSVIRLKEGTPDFLNVPISNDTFKYISLKTPDTGWYKHSEKFSTYKDEVYYSARYSLFETSATTPEEVYKLHPELFI